MASHLRIDFLMWISSRFCGKVIEFSLAERESLVYISSYFFREITLKSGLYNCKICISSTKTF